MLAAMSNRLDIVRTLLDHHANVNATDVSEQYGKGLMRGSIDRRAVDPWPNGAACGNPRASSGCGARIVSTWRQC